MANTMITDVLKFLEGRVPSEYAADISNAIALASVNYNIEKKFEEPTDEDYIPYYLDLYIVSMTVNGMSPLTIKLYKACLLDFLRTISKPTEELLADDIRAYMCIKQNQGLSSVTINTYRSVISAFLEWSCNEGYLAKNACRNVRKMKEPIKPREVLTEYEMECIRSSCQNVKERALIEFLYSTACRASELISVKRLDVDYINGRVILTGKGNKTRYSYLNERARYWVQLYLKTRNDNQPWLFVINRAPYKNMCKTSLEMIVKDVGRRAGLGDKVHPHLFRHTNATDSLRRGMPITDVQKILGHESLDTTMIYAEIDDQHVQNEHARCIV